MKEIFVKICWELTTLTHILLVHVRLSFPKLWQTCQTCRNNAKKCLGKKESNDMYSLLTRVHTMKNHISICFLSQYPLQRECVFFPEHKLKKAFQSDCKISNNCAKNCLLRGVTLNVSWLCFSATLVKPWFTLSDMVYWVQGLLSSYFKLWKPTNSILLL